MIDQIREFEEYSEYIGTIQDNFENLLPNAARVFNAGTALHTIRQMLKCHKDTWLYVLNDYHYLLLYDTLQYFCEIYNDMAAEIPTVYENNKRAILGGIYIEKIHFEELLSIYFYDIDFLLSADTVFGLGLDNRECLGIKDETFSISQGLSPHHEELKLKLCDNEDPVPPVPSRNWSQSSTEYPFHDPEDE